MVVTRRHNVSPDAIDRALDVCDCLNAIADVDTPALRRLFCVSVPCSQELADMPQVVTNQVHTESETPFYTVSSLGVINALVDENLAIAFDGESFCVAVRDSHPDNVEILDRE